MLDEFVVANREEINIDFMVKDSKRFVVSGGWGYAVFDYNAKSDSFTPGPFAADASACFCIPFGKNRTLLCVLAIRSG